MRSACWCRRRPPERPVRGAPARRGTRRDARRSWTCCSERRTVRNLALLDEPPAGGELLGAQAQAALAPDADPRDADVLERGGGVEVSHAREHAHSRAPAPAPLGGVERSGLDDLR